MPSVRKLTVHSNNLLPKSEKDLTVYSSAPLSHSMELSDVSMDYSKVYLPSVSMEFSVEEENSNGSTNPPTRKRQRLDHLSQEEKVMRRKMKNRVAAQSARDRKKAKMTELEEQVLQLEAQKRYLLIENEELRKKNAKLEKENTDLKLKLSLDVTDSHQKNIIPSPEVILPVPATESRVEEGRSLEYASLINGPQLKEQDLHLLALWMMRFVYLPTLARLMTFLICFNSAAIVCCNATSTVPKLKEVKKMKRPALQSPNHPNLARWWGPHQKAWNPSKN